MISVSIFRLQYLSPQDLSQTRDGKKVKRSMMTAKGALSLVFDSVIERY